MERFPKVPGLWILWWAVKLILRSVRMWLCPNIFCLSWDDFKWFCTIFWTRKILRSAIHFSQSFMVRLRSAIHFDCENLGEEDLQLWTRVKFFAGDHSVLFASSNLGGSSGHLLAKWPLAKWFIHAIHVYPNTYSLVIGYIAMENGPVSSLIFHDLPIKSDDFQ